MSRRPIPNWVAGIALLFCLFDVLVGALVYVSPGTIVRTTDFSAEGVRYLANLWAARQIAIGVIVGYSALRASVPMLQISLAAFGLMNLQDIAIGFMRGDAIVIVGAAVFTVLTAVMIWQLRKIPAL